MKTLRLLTITASFLFLNSCNSAIADGIMQNEISSRLKNTTGLQSVSVVVKEGIATLAGQVSNDSEKTTAENLAKIKGIREVRNNITVVSPTPAPTAVSKMDQKESETEASSEMPNYEEEAFTEAQKFSDEMVIVCGDSYYFGTNLGTIYECKDAPDITIKGNAVEPRELSQADRLNGVDPAPVEWEGYAIVKLLTCRGYHKSGNSYVVTEWYDYGEKFQLDLTKAKGVWTREQKQGKIQAQLYNVPVTCSQVNQLNKK